MGTTNWKSEPLFLLCVPVILGLALAGKLGYKNADKKINKISEWTLSFSEE